MPVHLLRAARPAGWVNCFSMRASTMPRAQNRAAKGWILKEDEIGHMPIWLYDLSMVKVYSGRDLQRCLWCHLSGPSITWCDIPPSLPLFTVHTLYKQLLYKIIRTAKSLPNYGYWTKKRVPLLFSRPIFNTTFSIQKWIFNARIISKLEDKKVKNYFDHRASQEKIIITYFYFTFYHVHI